ncbi:MAG: 4Fe-4S binding protein [Chloroflexi bacterium]|nr:4Fe-4S binding protein [Chloroflexota bacterium]
MSGKDITLSPDERDVYFKFIEWLKQSWYGVPESDFLLPYVAARYTPQEAALLTGMPFSPKTLSELSELTKTNVDMLRQKLDELASKGLVYKQVKDGSERYHLHDVFTNYRGFGWPGSHAQYSQAVGPLQHKYITGGLMSPWQNVKEKGLRVLPIDAAIEDTRGVLPYEEIRKILDKVEYFSVSHCPCRHANNLNPDSPDCQYPTEVCLHFDKLGRYIVENGMGREITRQETEEILKHSADLGLIHGISNQQEKPDTICNCCRDCCIWFLAMNKYGHKGSLTPSNFRITVNQSTCTGCGLCVKRCPMQALTLQDMPSAKGRKTIAKGKDGRQRELSNKTGHVSQLNTELCIGCGVCAYKCPSQSLSLVRNAAEHHPPMTGRDWAMEFISTRKPA